MGQGGLPGGEKVALSSDLGDKQLPWVGSPGKGQAEGFTGWFHLKLMSLFILPFFRPFSVAQMLHYFIKEPHKGHREGCLGKGTGTHQGPHFEHLRARR